MIADSMITDADRQTSRTFLRSLQLDVAEPEFFDEAYVATTQYVPWPKSYGGDLVAQAVAAASRSVGDDRALNSMHSYFLRPADILRPVRYEVERVRDGRGYSTRQVRAFQNGKAVFVALASFQVPETGPEFTAEQPPEFWAQLPAPEDLPSSATLLAGADGAAAEYWSGGRSFDMRHVDGALYGIDAGAGPTAKAATGTTADATTTGAPAAAALAPASRQAVWIKAFDTLPDDPRLQQAALAYVCDYTILESVLRTQGLSWAEPKLVTASLDHSMWFHRPGRVDEWVLYLQDAVSLQSGRGLASGRFYTRDGVLLASVAQEGLIRHTPTV